MPSLDERLEPRKPFPQLLKELGIRSSLVVESNDGGFLGHVRRTKERKGT